MTEKDFKNKVLQKFDQIDSRFDQIDQRFDQVDRHLIRVDGQLDLLASKLFEHDDRLDRLESKVDNCVTKQVFTSAFEGLTTLVKNIQDDYAFHVSWLRRLEERSEMHHKLLGLQ